jgi:hypothetical protein
VRVAGFFAQVLVHVGEKALCVMVLLVEQLNLFEDYSFCSSQLLQMAIKYAYFQRFFILPSRNSGTVDAQGFPF